MSSPRPSGRRYHLKRILGEGAFGRVYLAEQESEGGFRRLVALKVLNSSVARKTEAETRMRDEARVLGQLQHRNIVAVLDLVRLGQRWAIVMDHIPGVDLEVLSHQGPVPPAAAFAIGAGIGRALAAASAATDSDGQPLNVVHRDIKPSNVRITAEAEVKVLDFGVARFSLEGREHQTKGVGWVGTERYMAPERILGQGDTAAGDVYALGATVYELLCGEPLGRTPALPKQHATLVSEAIARLTPPPDAPPAWSDALSALVQTLSAEPGERPTASEVSKAWAGAVASLPGESLQAFAARVVPRLRSSTAEVGDTAEGVLEEGSRDEATVLRSDSLDPSGLSSTGARLPSWTAVAALLGVLVGGAGLVAFAVAGFITFDVVRGASERPAVEAMAPGTSLEFAPAPVSEVGPTSVQPKPTPSVAPVAPKLAPRPRPKGPSKPTVEVSKALFTLKNASGIWVGCGTVEARGTSSARIEGFPAGSCEVRANYLGVDYQSVVEVTAPRTVACRVNGEEMTCS
ncbi:MAG: protein kinase [Myxococcota bacterium]